VPKKKIQHSVFELKIHISYFVLFLALKKKNSPPTTTSE